MVGRGKGGKGLDSISQNGEPPKDLLKREREYREKRSNLIEKKRKFQTKRQSNVKDEDRQARGNSNNSCIIPFVDISVKYYSEISVDQKQHTNFSKHERHDDEKDLLSLLMESVNSHFCNDLCFERVPKVDFERIYSPERSIDMSHIDVQPCRGVSICDEKCDEATCQFAFQLVDEFIKHVETCIPTNDMKMSKTTYLYGPKQFIIYTYQSCGKRVHYIWDHDDSFEACYLLQSPAEYLVGGSHGGHAFYVLPTLNYESSDGSCEYILECLTSPNDDLVNSNDDDQNFDYVHEYNDSSPEKEIEISHLLQCFRNFLHGLLGDRYH
ncbi:hypothetical protein C9374_004423 [Naegleria lovaniensis]|uniref:Uncharacterized protein n=1 Tax=Naegleria lovaniensis TaxID=51637 RepID=A0AA88GLB0_NAELO|nr:uncharacterized protein C9374_004423 [Naegleria lovaniensis]KAG2383086.1 hypothetical protein C9374_004423 [Naegleria lovaniensis]